MTTWIDYLSYYTMPALLFIVAPSAAGSFLAIGLRDRRDGAVPRGWWALMIATFAWPMVILAIAFAFVADHPMLGQGQSAGGTVLGLATLAGLASPFVLGAATLHWSDQRGNGWRAGVMVACLSIIPVILMALLGAAQMVSGVPL